MSRLAVVGFSNDSGVGRELVSATRQLPVSSAFILHHSEYPTRVELLPISAFSVSKGKGHYREMEVYLEKHKPDTILTWDGPGRPEFPQLWNSKGIYWVNVVHYDWFNPDKMDGWKGVHLVAPNEMCRRLLKEEHGLSSTLLPVPVDTDRFAFRKREKAVSFVSVYGHGGAYHRRSLPELFLAWSELSGAPPLTVHAQVRPLELETALPPAGVEIKVGNLSEPEDLYEHADVAVQLSRYEGVGISLLEAMSCGLPVVTVKAPPMSEIAPELTVPVEEIRIVKLAGKDVVTSIPSPSGARELLDYLVGRDISELSLKVRWRMEKYYSWKALRPRWLELLK